MLIPLVFFLTSTAAILSHESQLRIDLKNPTYSNGIIFTHQGGVIQNEELRIQAKSIAYVNTQEAGQQIQKVEAEGDLLVLYKNRAYVGKKLEFDFTNNSGVIFDGKTSSSMWFIGGDTIRLNPDGSYKIDYAYITTCENIDSSWQLSAKKVTVLKEQLFSAKDLKLKFMNMTTAWFPKFKANLKKDKDSLFKYYLNFNRGPKAGIRYQLYSWKDFELYGRLEYRFFKGFAGAIETKYLTPNQLTSFVTRSYLGKDRLFNAPDIEKRYRIQGVLDSKSESGKTKTYLSWDKYSDVRMPQDFVTDDFEVNSAKQTIFHLYHKEKDIITWLKVRPRVNSFESIQQDLPTLFITTKPREIKNSKIISSNFAKLSYLNFQYSDDLIRDLQSFASPRLEINQTIQRPFSFGPVNLSANLSLVGIFYGTSPSHTSQCLATLNYGAYANLLGQKTYKKFKHTIKPYLDFQGYTTPTSSPTDHYIFSINDGYDKIQQLTFGVKNLFFSKDKKEKLQNIAFDLYANAFFSQNKTYPIVPKAYFKLECNLASLFFFSHSCWNFQNQVLDFFNSQLKWTLSENAAVYLEGRYRSKYDWRKANHTNFMLDVYKDQNELLHSPLSDQRATILSKLFIRLNPFWEFEFESHHGFLRFYKNSIHQEPYNEFRFHLYTWISSAWKLHMYYGYTLKTHFDWNIKIQMANKGF